MADNELLEKGDADLDFDFGAKKKKKKKGAEQEGAEPQPESTSSGAQETPAADDAGLDDLEMFGDMKKKKKKKVVEAEAPKEESVDDLMEDFDDMKKKKKKNMNMNEFEKELNEIEDDAEGDIVYDSEGAAKETDDSDVKFGSDAISSSEDPWVGTDREYTYKELLDRAFRIIKQANPDMEGGRKRYTMIPPQVVREGTKKTLFANLSEICKRMHRQPDHVISFLFSELGTTGSVDGGQRLIIKGRFQPTQIETVLRSYIVEYVTCKICKSPDTVLTKENRLTFMQCQSCGAKRSVSNIKSGFSAQVEKRKAQ